LRRKKKEGGKGRERRDFSWAQQRSGKEKLRLFEFPRLEAGGECRLLLRGKKGGRGEGAHVAIRQHEKGENFMNFWHKKKGGTQNFLEKKKRGPIASLWPGKKRGLFQKKRLKTGERYGNGCPGEKKEKSQRENITPAAEAEKKGSTLPLPPEEGTEVW